MDRSPFILVCFLLILLLKQVIFSKEQDTVFASLKTAPVGSTTLNTEEANRKSNCFRGRPLAKCASFWLTEFSYSYRFDAPSKRNPNSGANYYFTWELGGMKNLNETSALGATILFGADDDGTRFGLKARYRRWLNQTTSIDLSPGILLGGSNNQFNAGFPGFTSHIGLNFGDWFALIVQMEAVRLDTVGTDIGWYGGLKLGSYPGLIGSIVGPIAALLIVSIEFSGTSF